MKPRLTSWAHLSKGERRRRTLVFLCKAYGLSLVTMLPAVLLFDWYWFDTTGLFIGLALGGGRWPVTTAYKTTPGFGKA